MLNIGEKIETIIFARADGGLGEYLGASGQTFGACRIDGVVYKVERNNEVDADTVWTVRNVNEGTVATHDDYYGLPLIKESDFK